MPKNQSKHKVNSFIKNETIRLFGRKERRRRVGEKKRKPAICCLSIETLKIKQQRNLENKDMEKDMRGVYLSKEIRCITVIKK